MSQIEELYIGQRGYPMVAEVRGQEVLLYQQFGSYQGEWMMLARDASNYFIYKDYYGSCSGCDSYEANFDYGNDDSVSMEKAQEFAKEYPPFLEIPVATMRNIAKNGTLLNLLPKNVRTGYSDDIDMPAIAQDMMLAAKLAENIDITCNDILQAPNQELKQRALKKYGYERFVADADMEVIHKDGENSLLKSGDIVFAYVKDSSTPKRYLLRVPPNMERVRQAIAWTFNMTEDEYQPLVET